ncbi:major facilitator superfamily domain-containing protein [Immersiella caudata]|uniref:Major facilitator superfamily domain-containing protein n=1 Tax=Immersiella caudata TaxID=314043 RepID=A0AA39WXH8_9PEZI|nr:major facilitator superfamily domain-containing protein [Immersiella caudata]
MAPSHPRPAASSSSSTTAGENAIVNVDVDVEAQQPRTGVSHISFVLDQAGVTPEVLSYIYPGEGTAGKPYIVDFLPQDARNPLQFPQWKKWTITILQAIATLAVALVSTAYSGGISDVIIEFRVSTELAILGLSVFVLGFAIGPLLWAPLSEFYGRQILFFITYMALTVFNAGAAGSKNIETLIILRFFAGAFGSSPMTNCGGVIADIFSAEERGLAAGVFALAPFLGPSIGPIIGGFLGETEGWRWVEGLMAIFTGTLWIACSLFVPETYAPVLLRRRAAKLSKMTGKVYISKLDVSTHGDGSAATKKAVKEEQIKKALLRPWVLLLREPIVFLTSVYIAIVYGTLYLLFAAFPIIFQVHRGWSPGIGGLAFIGVAVGMMVGVFYAMYDNKRYSRVAAANGGSAPPEARLPPAIVGSVLLPVGLFWFAWTNGSYVHWVVPIIASGFFAAGLVLVFLALLTYLIDSYTVFAASVLAANSVLRSLFGAAFPLFTTYMYANLGIHWASTIPAFLALACVPFPLLFYRYGGQIRMRCKYAAEAAVVLAAMRAKNVPITEVAEEQAADEAMMRIATRDTMERARSRREREREVGVMPVQASDDERTVASRGGEGEEKHDEEKVAGRQLAEVEDQGSEEKAEDPLPGVEKALAEGESGGEKSERQQLPPVEDTKSESGVDDLAERSSADEPNKQTMVEEEPSVKPSDETTP